MTEAPKDDHTPAVVLQEPPGGVKRSLPRADGGFVLRPEEDRPSGLHPGWAEVLAPGEIVFWQGKPSADPRFAGGNLPFFVMAFVGLVVLLNSGFGAPALPFILVVMYLFFRHRMRRPKSGVTRDRSYLLTNRAAYLARDDGQALHSIEAFPITSSMRLGLGPRSVSFTTRRNAQGGVEPEGFLDISDARQVHDLIRNLQKGLA